MPSIHHGNRTAVSLETSSTMAMLTLRTTATWLGQSQVPTTQATSVSTPSTRRTASMEHRSTNMFSKVHSSNPLLRRTWTRCVSLQLSTASKRLSSKPTRKMTGKQSFVRSLLANVEVWTHPQRLCTLSTMISSTRKRVGYHTTTR